MKCFLFMFALCSVGPFIDGAMKNIPAENVEDIIPEKAPPELVLLVAKESALLGPGKDNMDFTNDVDRKKILRSGDYWNAVWKEEVTGKKALRSAKQKTNLAPPAAPRPSRNFRNLATTQAEEDAFDYRKAREKMKDAKFTSTVGSIAHLVKGALGGGILSGHVSYMKGGVGAAIPLNIFFGTYMAYCLYLLVKSTQVLYRRTRIPAMSYADVGEASAMTHRNPSVQRWSKAFRYTIDAIICMDLFGSCCCYQIIIAKTIKQLVENTPKSEFAATIPGYPDLRVYLAVMIPLVVAICLIRHLKRLAPFSIVANFVIVLCIMLTIYYAFTRNPTFSNLTLFTTPYGTLEYVGMSVFSMSCSGVVIAIESNMARPDQFNIALFVGMALIILFVFSASFFGYVAFLNNCVPPVTLNFPMETVPKILKGLIAVMIYVTHALNFWVPFNLCFYYIKRRYAPEKQIFYEYIYRALFVIGIGCVAILFPDINALMGFIGCFCLSNMAFIWPNVITLLVIWERPGLGKMKWRLWRAMVLMSIGLFIFVAGSVVNAIELVSVFIKLNVADKPKEGGGGGATPPPAEGGG